MNFAPVSRNADNILRLRPAPYLGVDWEWDIRTDTPTILGVSDGQLTVSAEHSAAWPHLQTILDRPDIRLVGHNFLQADLQVMNKLGASFPQDRVDDTIVYHWLLNLDLCKAGGKILDGEGDKRGRGFMNLGTAMMLATEASNWKDCVGEEQCRYEHRPCPSHDVFGYNGNDAYWPVKAIEPMKRKAKMRGVDWLYPVHRDLSVVMAAMTERGILIDREYVRGLEAHFHDEQEKYYKEEAIRVPGKRSGTTKKGTRITGSLGFNPESAVQVRKALEAAGISVKDTTEDTIRAACRDNPESSTLAALLDYKELGAGASRWFATREWNAETREWDGYVDDNGYIHPSFSLFTSSGRLTSSRPNFQNIPVRRGTEIRRAVIAPKGQVIYEADLSNAENRAFLWMAGYTELPNIDLHSWVAEIMGAVDDHPFSVKMGGKRQAAKSVQHASNYGEGLSLLTEKDLSSSRIRAEVRDHARVVFEDWTFNDGGQEYCVSFTGAHLAERAFGDRSRASRRLALEIQEKYFARFPLVRQLQRKITAQVEREQIVRPPSGLVTLSYGSAADRIKSALALWGSQPVAMWTKLAMLKAEQESRLRECLRAQIHDALFFYISDSQAAINVSATIREVMNVSIPGMEGLFIPAEIKMGQNWAGMTKI